TLPYAEFQAIDNFGMGILRSAQNQLIALQNINEAGVALHQGGSKIDHAGQYFVEAVRRRQPDTNLVQQINV
ncbi:MAG: hypothetical protein WBW77_12965, partial [Candidatus Sulfotelmatobacter sp.]